MTATDDELDLEVTDPGPAATGGRDVAGPRAASASPNGSGCVGGTVAFGAQDAGFRVHATLPIGARR